MAKRKCKHDWDLWMPSSISAAMRPAVFVDDAEYGVCALCGCEKERDDFGKWRYRAAKEAADE